ncbi:hypothetical protein NDU88_006141 [Pleurodeles waltl]|uniref:Uncharacterized protein n=1 Tax=Pleurodeles waltl TaxID=8319 RepID=A0AAV7RR96_PLEWA|nr:hypothetical protein NDU88_006141 [Pleurodeles waltl]
MSGWGGRLMLTASPRCSGGSYGAEQGVEPGGLCEGGLNIWPPLLDPQGGQRSVFVNDPLVERWGRRSRDRLSSPLRGADGKGVHPHPSRRGLRRMKRIQMVR